MTRMVFDTILDPSGVPIEGFPVTFTVKPSTSTLDATYPQVTITVETDADGAYEVELATGVRYEVGLSGSFIPRGVSSEKPQGSVFHIVVPDGDGPISMGAIRALGYPIPPADPDIVQAVVAAVLARLIPAGGLAGQVLTKSSDDNYDVTWQTPRTGYGQ
jgi:hypothetical protein